MRVPGMAGGVAWMENEWCNFSHLQWWEVKEKQQQRKIQYQVNRYAFEMDKQDPLLLDQHWREHKPDNGEREQPEQVNQAK